MKAVVSDRGVISERHIRLYIGTLLMSVSVSMCYSSLILPVLESDSMVSATLPSVLLAESDSTQVDRGQRDGQGSQS